MEKTTVFNLIILDESGSMCGCTNATISGCNETIYAAKNIQKKHGDSQRSFMSIYAFQSGGPRPSRYIIKNADVNTVVPITQKDYEPNGCTPLLDAIGSTLVDLKEIASTHADSMGIVTIITDGYENSSEHYNYDQIKSLISQLKELGWTFNFIGANIDVMKVSRAMAIDNAMSFENDEDGTGAMWTKYKMQLEKEAEDRAFAEQSMSIEDRKMRRVISSKNFFHR